MLNQYVTILRPIFAKWETLLSADDSKFIFEELDHDEPEVAVIHFMGAVMGKSLSKEDAKTIADVAQLLSHRKDIVRDFAEEQGLDLGNYPDVSV